MNQPKDFTKAHLKDLELIFQQLVLIDRADSLEASEKEINRLLQALGDYTGAGRAYIFEALENEKVYTNTYEWCAEGVLPQIQNLQKIHAEEMPCWYQLFKEGKSVVIPDLEVIRVTMPSEYEILSFQDIVTEISFPIFWKKQLSGFIGLDNPRIDEANTFINMLELVGGHLGSIWSGYRQDKKLDENRIELRQEQEYLSVLSRDYIAVYAVNLGYGRSRFLKLENEQIASSFRWQAEREITNYDAAISMYAEKFVDASNRQDFIRRLDRAYLEQEFKKRERCAFRYRTRMEDGRIKYFEAYAVCMEPEKGSVRMMLGFRNVDDIVAQERRRQNELEVALEETKLSNEIISAISKIYVSIFRIDLERDFYEEVSSENEIHRLTGNSGEASSKMVEICENFVATEYRDRVRKFFDLTTLADRLSEEETLAMEYLATDGNWHIARFVVKKRDFSGRTVNVLYVTRIISDSKRREQNWIAIAEEASRANAAKTEFLSRMAHDIRTPLNAMLGFTRIAKENLEQHEKVKDAFEKIEAAGKYLQQLADDVLDLTQIENGQMRNEPQETNVLKLYDECMDIIQNTKGRKNLELSGKKHDIFREYVWIDALRLKQIYVNLLSNAVKYTPDGGKVTFEMYEEPSEKEGMVKFISVIEDTGIGMTTAYMKEMYHKFTRAVDTRVNQVRGSGLGLSIVKQLVDLMDGKISVKSVPEKGTRFQLEFEVACPERLTKEGSGQANGEHRCKIEAACVGLHLLIAEDNDLNYEVAEELLAMKQISCERAEDGRVCVEKFAGSEEGTYDAILMDIQMPVMNGVEAASMIRGMERPDAAAIPIIAMTANAFSEDVKKSMDAGMNEHLAKPMNLEKLLDTLYRCCKTNRE